MIRSQQLADDGLSVMAKIAGTQDFKPYQWRGQAGWDPSRLGPMKKDERKRERAHRQREERLAKFTALREEGLSAADAAAQLGLSQSTGFAYEQSRRDRLADAEGGDRP